MHLEIFSLRDLVAILVFGLMMFIAVAVFRSYGRAARRPRPMNPELRQIACQVAASIPHGAATDTGFTFAYRNFSGRVDFTADRTEILIHTRGLVQAMVEIVPVGFLGSMLLPDNEDRFRIRGSQAECSRIFRTRADAQILKEIGVTYTLRMVPEWLSFSIHALPGSAASLSYWLGCAFQLVNLLPAPEGSQNVQVMSITHQAGDNTSCQVCGSTLSTGALVRCEKCSTMHHEDCWDYTKSCSTFGCKSVRFTR